MRFRIVPFKFPGEIVTGYAHPGYAHSLAEFGRPRQLPRCQGWLLERQIPGLPDYDAIGCYPLFTCQDWPQLWSDLAEIGRELVSLSLVTDPFGSFDVAHLRQCFDLVRPFKQHFIVDLGRSPLSFVSYHHRRNTRKARGAVQVEKCENPLEFSEDWFRLYSFLKKRHKINGLPAFSRTALTRQLQVPGLSMFRAVHNQATVGITLWYVQGGVGYYHLGASSPVGYKLCASFALFWQAIEYFADFGLKWLDLGAGAGVQNDGTDGLSRFKRGWFTGTRTAYFCGRIFDSNRYSEIVRAKKIVANGYFPAYRCGEFGQSD